MADARLLQIGLELFKSYEAMTEIDLAPLTVVLGRNNSGKSTLVQALLLLKQTLEHPRADVQLHLEGQVDALSLRELTFGWPQAEAAGPSIRLRWQSTVDVTRALREAKHPEISNLTSLGGVTWLADAVDPPNEKVLETELYLSFREREGRPGVHFITLESRDPARPKARGGRAVLRESNGRWVTHWRREEAERLEVTFDHFLPYLSLDRRSVGPRHRERAWHNAFLLLFKQPLDDLKQLLLGLQFLASTRSLPPSLYRPTSAPLDNIGVSGELAAHMMHARRLDVVHYVPPVAMVSGEVTLPERVHARPFGDAVNEVLRGLGVDAQVRVEDFPNLGFRLLFGDASLAHVGRGLTYLLPIVELGLFADPLRFAGSEGELALTDYEKACRQSTHLVFEEPESHLHPKVQSRLAHWMLSLALAKRQVIVETHSDHLVRRLRGLIARARVGSPLERWMAENVALVEVEQDPSGRSSLKTARLTSKGSLVENWPADFMDEATDEESQIYYAGLSKEVVSSPATGSGIVHDVDPEPESEFEP